ncbi:MAG: hypothetical protein OXC28_07095 [Defluviicoccus sp.]|nr:hypothetical protein [Defluviicoccus sp.]
MYTTPWFRNWLAGKIAEEAPTLSLHTDVPGDDGTAGELATGGGGNYARKALAAADITVEADGAQADNAADIEHFTPNAASAGAAVTHVGYWFGANFAGWSALRRPQDTIAGDPFVIVAGTAGFEVKPPAEPG